MTTQPSTSHRIFRASLIVMGAYVIAKPVGLVRQALIARAFGTGPALDAFVAASNFPELLFTLISGGALLTAFLPVFTGYLAREERDGAWKLASATLNVVFLLTALLALISAAFAPWIARLAAPGFSDENLELTASLMRLILVSTVVFSASGIVMGTLNAHQHFLLPAIAPILYDLGIIAGALVLAPRIGVYGLAWGIVAGSLLHLGVQIPGLIRIGARWTAALDLRDAGLRRVAALMVPRALGLGVVQLNFVITYALASLIGAGAVSTLRFGWMLMQVPETIIGTAIATAAFPTLSEQAARNSPDGLRQTLSSTLRAILALTIPAAVGLVLVGRPLTRLMFERGSFDAASTQAVVWALQFYAVGLAGHAALEVVARTFFAQQDTRTPLGVAFAAMLVNVMLSLLLMRPLGHGGLALANSLAVTLEVTWLLLIARRRLGGIEGRALLTSVARFATGSAAMALVIGLWMILARSVDERLVGMASAILGAAVYLVVTLAMGSPEIRALLKLVMRRRTEKRDAAAIEPG